MICSSCGAPTPASPCVACTAEPRLQGRYSLLEVLGSGGSGVAFRAHDAETDDIVVVKELLLHQAEDLKALELFEREANTLKNLNHPGVPQFYASFQAGTGRNTGLYLVMEYIDGKTLKDLQHGLPFSETKALTYIESIAATLSYLHHLSPPRYPPRHQAFQYHGGTP